MGQSLFPLDGCTAGCMAGVATRAQNISAHPDLKQAYLHGARGMPSTAQRPGVCADALQSWVFVQPHALQLTTMRARVLHCRPMCSQSWALYLCCMLRCWRGCTSGSMSSPRHLSCWPRHAAYCTSWPASQWEKQSAKRGVFTKHSTVPQCLWPQAHQHIMLVADPNLCRQ